jgi:hypothetical protein
MPDKPKKPSPKKIDLDWKELDALLQFKVPLYFVADYIGVSRDTIIRRIKEKYDMTYGEYHNLKMQRTATKLQQKAIEMALNGDRTMLIFCLKNMAGWTDKQEQIHKGEHVNIAFGKDAT